jgi:hypothetical protein
MDRNGRRAGTRPVAGFDERDLDRHRSNDTVLNS